MTRKNKLYITGTTPRVSRVPIARPKEITIAMLMNSGSCQTINGARPSTVVIVVIMIGRKRETAAVTIAV